MEINLHIQCKKIDKNHKEALEEYIKRLSPWCKVKLYAYKTFSNQNLRKGTKLFFLTPGNHTLSSPELSDMINTLNIKGYSCIDFFINPKKEFIDSFYEKDFSFELFHLSSFDMSHQLTAVVLTEQLYRAYTIQNNITYHK
ncbi:MAG: 23S rRNA (pseudouridine(1915)-N(3))-methyltransferase RlmH [Lachnospiraceae bacterium]|nr:23S rRNA (pseudouridine(1915)-N(3))-methyltransferase RlmH [Lachnospiraceae bacterium]